MKLNYRPVKHILTYYRTDYQSGLEIFDYYMANWQYKIYYEDYIEGWMEQLEQLQFVDQAVRIVTADHVYSFSDYSWREDGKYVPQHWKDNMFNIKGYK